MNLKLIQVFPLWVLNDCKCNQKMGIRPTDCSFVKVDQMIAYALGEMAKPTWEGEEVEEELPVRWHPASLNCYEVVTAWVHPR